MHLPIKTLRVLPNPWTAVHADKGPQGLCNADNGGREAAPLQYLGARFSLNVNAKFDKGDPRQSDTDYTFVYPSLNETLSGPSSDAPEGIPVPVGSHFYRDRLQDGSLVPADEKTANALVCMFKNMGEARADGIKNFEAHYGEGSFAVAFPALAAADKAQATTAPAEAAPAAPAKSAAKDSTKSAPQVTEGNKP